MYLVHNKEPGNNSFILEFYREEAQAKLQALKERDRADLLLHSQEMRELQRRFDLDSKLQDFLGVKGQKRIMADLEAKEAIKKQQQKEATEHLITTYNSILDQIKQFSGENDIDKLAARFLKQEEENFTLFNYVNELNNEVRYQSKVITTNIFWGDPRVVLCRVWIICS